MLITGASSGIGAETARAAVADGYRVALGARRVDRLEALAEELGGPEVAIPVGCDVTDWDSVNAFVDRAKDSFGRLDVVFANAGFGAKRGFLEETVEHWESMVLTNVLGVALTIRATLPTLLEQDSGHYVITSSVAGRRALPGSLYSSTKLAVTGIGESLRKELREMRGNETIKVTLIEPGMVDTPFFDEQPPHSIEPVDVASSVMFAIGQPAHVDLNEILIRPASQPT